MQQAKLFQIKAFLNKISPGGRHVYK
jgi:hypothetical protein